MGLLNKKLSSWADTCRRIAGCSKREPSASSQKSAEFRLGHGHREHRLSGSGERDDEPRVESLYFPKFPSRQRNYAVRRRRRRQPDNNNGAGTTSCHLCDNRRQREAGHNN